MLHEFSRIVVADFSDIVASVQFIHYKRASLPEKLRLHLRDGSFVDLWVNPSGSRYSFHWVEESHLSDDLTAALKDFLNFVREKLVEFGA